MKKVLPELVKKYGDIFTTGDALFEAENNKSVLSVSPSFDLGLNGGLLEGTWNNIAGPTNVGKTTLALQIIANAHKEGRMGIFVDAENKLHNYNVQIEGFDPDKFIKIENKDQTKGMSAEDYMNTMYDLLKMPEYKGSVCVVDSFSSMLPRAEMDGEISGQIRATMPKLLTHFIKKMLHIVKTQNIIMIPILHYITNTSGYGKLRNADCGVMIQYQASTKIDFKSSKAWEEDGKQVGLIMECEIARSSKGGTGSTVTSYVRFGTGIDKVVELMEMGISLGLIDKAGSWFTPSYLEGTDLDELGKTKVQGQKKLREFLMDNQGAYLALEQKLKETL